MVLRDITQKIEGDAQDLALRITEAAKSEASDIQAEAEKKAQEERSAYKQETQKLLQENEERAESTARQTGKILIQNKKRTILDDVFTSARERLSSLSDEEYKKFLQTLLHDLPKEKGILLAPKDKVAITQKAAEDADLNVSVEESDRLRAGCIFQGDTYEYDLSFERLLKNKQMGLETSVSQILFEQ